MLTMTKENKTQPKLKKILFLIISLLKNYTGSIQTIYSSGNATKNFRTELVAKRQNKSDLEEVVKYINGKQNMC